jgi:hypothetical protein
MILCIAVCAEVPQVSNVNVPQSDISFSIDGNDNLWSGKVTFDLTDDSDTNYVSILLASPDSVHVPDSMWGDVRTAPGAGKTVYFTFRRSGSGFGSGCSLRVTAGDSAIDADCEPMTPFPKRVIIFDDFETRKPVFGWFGGWKSNPSGTGTFNRRCMMSDQREPHTKVGFNAVPGPRCDNVNKSYFQYRYTGVMAIPSQQLQMYNMEEADNYHNYITIVPFGWRTYVHDWAHARPNDGSGDGFQLGERMDEFYCLVRPPWNYATDTLFMDNIILYAQHEDSIGAIKEMEERFPRRVAFLGSFESGTKDPFWSGEYELLQSGLPGSYWAFAHAIDSTGGSGKYIKLDTPHETNTPWGRFAGHQTRLRFRYFIKGNTTSLTVKFDGKIMGIELAPESWSVQLDNLETGRWAWITANFTEDGTTGSGNPRKLSNGDEVNWISFLMPGATGTDDFYVDEVTMYEPQ